MLAVADRHGRAGGADLDAGSAVAAADGPVQDALVQDAPELGRVRAVQYRLPGQPRGDLPATAGGRAVLDVLNDDRVL